MADHPAPERTQDPIPQQAPRKRKFTELFRHTLTELKTALDEELSGKTSPNIPSPPAEVASGTTISIEEVMQTSAEMEQGLEHLQTNHTTLGRQIDTILSLEPEAQRELVTLMWQTVEQMEASLTAVQEAHFLLQRTLRDKRLLLASTTQELHQSLERDTAQHATIADLRQTSARLLHEQSALQHQLALHEANLTRVQQQHATLSQEYDGLIGKHHQLFQRYTQEQRHKAS